MWLSSLVLAPLACQPEATTEPDSALEPPAPFSFVVLADPHIVQEGDRADRLRRAVDWVNEQAVPRDIALVVVVGDIGWTDTGLTLSRELLDELAVPYVPVLGDNEVHISASEQRFDEVFTPQYALLAETFDDWHRAPSEVVNPNVGTTSWIQNFSFSYGGLRFVGLDWVSRADGLIGELADLNDFDGGTWPFFTQAMHALAPGESEDVLLFSHHPMLVLPGAFTIDQMERITGVTDPVAGRVAAAFAGHMHYDEDEPAGDRGYSVHVTDATWDDEVTVRVVDVRWEADHFVYEQELVIVP